MEVKKSNLYRFVQERLLLKKKEQDKIKQAFKLLPYLPRDCVASILLCLPLRDLHTSKFVCKLWHQTINNPEFIANHLRRSQTVFILTKPMEVNLYTDFSNNRMVSVFSENPKTVSVEAKLHGSSSAIFFDKSIVPQRSKHYIKFVEVDGGCFRLREYNVSCLGKIRASCDGLILLDNSVKGGVVVMNPVTRKLLPIPLGTISTREESYGFAPTVATGVYKVVHLFTDPLSHVSCEVISIGSRSWRAIDGPSFGLLKCFMHYPVYALEALHWIPHINFGDYIVSMEVENEKFHKIALPKSGKPHDRVVELNGFLAFVTHSGSDQIDVWILKELLGNVWTKHHSISTGSISDLIPLCCSRVEGDLVFKSNREPRSLYFYNFRLQEMREVTMEANNRVPFSLTCIPHVNSLVSWRSGN